MVDSDWPDAIRSQRRGDILNRLFINSTCGSSAMQTTFFLSFWIGCTTSILAILNVQEKNISISIELFETNLYNIYINRIVTVKTYLVEDSFVFEEEHHYF